MAEILSSDNSVEQEVIDSHEAEIADSLRVGEEIEAAHEERLAGKYRNVEDLEKAYLELQSKLGSKEESTQEQPKTEEPTSETSSLLNNLYDEWNSTQKLSPETLEKVKQADQSDLVQAYLEARIQGGGQPMTDADVRSVQDMVGGPEQYQTLIGWAQQNWAPEEVSAFDSVVETGNVNAIGLALKGLYYQYTEANGVEGTTYQGKAAPRTEVFRSQAELIQAMNDPRYDDDEAYRSDVLRKLDNSNIQF